ncbi:MAG: hypothetical protein HQL84_08760 [Magnetococcales bacterium]|nr:hypothetical protein [Magnetococcales bacterium]MBF0150121.1 hypothetical protein [Magnetococcales bacterium]
MAVIKGVTGGVSGAGTGGRSFVIAFGLFVEPASTCERPGSSRVMKAG